MPAPSLPPLPDDDLTRVGKRDVTLRRHSRIRTLTAQGPEDLFETISQALLNAVDRDAISGWGAVVHVITADGITTRTLKGRMD